MFAPYFDPIGAWSSILLDKNGPEDLDAQVPALGVTWSASEPFAKLTLDEFQHTLSYEAETNANISRYVHALEVTQGDPRSVLLAETLTLPASWLKPGSYLTTTATGYFSSEEDPPLRRKWPSGNLEANDPRAFAGGEFKRYFLTDFALGKATWICPGQPFGLQLAWDVSLLPYLWFEQSGAGETAVVRLRAASGLTTALHDGHGLVEIPTGKPLIISLQLTALPV